MKSITIVIEGDPIAKARCRVNMKNRRIFDSQLHEKVATRIYIEKALTEHNIANFFKGPCFADITFYVPLRKRSKNKEGDYCYSRPDIDNMVKWFYDCGNGLLYKDDSIIVEEHARKVYSAHPRTIIFFKELCEEKERDSLSTI